VVAHFTPQSYGASFEDAIYTVDGIYTYGDDGESRYARLYFNDGVLRQVFGFTDIDMVAVGSYYAGAHIIHLDGAYGGTGAAPEISKKNIAMPIEYALPKVHRFLEAEGIRNEITLIASGGLRTAFDVAKAIALGADGVVLGTAELVAIGCIRIAQCEKGLGCPFGITTTDPEHAAKIDADVGYQKIVNMYNGWLWQIAGILEMLGMKSISELRGRSDLLVYLT